MERILYRVAQQLALTLILAVPVAALFAPDLGELMGTWRFTAGILYVNWVIGMVLGPVPPKNIFSGKGLTYPR